MIGCQAPFDFDVSVKDIYSAVMTGAQLVLIPKEYFSTPPRLLDYLCERKVTTLTWAVSALTLVSSLKGLKYRIPEHVNKVMFSGEAMPPKQLKLWQEALPDAPVCQSVRPHGDHLQLYILPDRESVRRRGEDPGSEMHFRGENGISPR